MLVSSDEDSSRPLGLNGEPLLPERSGARRWPTGMMTAALIVCAVFAVKTWSSTVRTATATSQTGLPKVQRKYGYADAAPGYAAAPQAAAGYGYGQDPVQDAYNAQAGAGYAQTAYGTAQAASGYAQTAYGQAGFAGQAAQADAGYGQAGSDQQAGYGYSIDAGDANGYAPAPYTGPLEFTNGGGGPETVAGTKLVQAGAEDLGAENEIRPDEPIPPADYATENQPMTLMLYRAQSQQDYPMRNVNVADLAGVMWYLHNEIMGFADAENSIRHFNITRIIRFKAVVWNPKEFWDLYHTKFAPYIAYNAAKCSAEGCDQYATYGAPVGCQIAAKAVANYQSVVGGDPVWLSLPGPCPLHEYGAKTPECVWQSPGGDCGSGKDITGSKDCSFVLTWYGEVRLDHFLPTYEGTSQPIDFKSFLAMGGREYDRDTDQGTYNTFWDGVHDATANNGRMQAVLNRFDELYPQWAEDSKLVDEVVCDSLR